MFKYKDTEIVSQYHKRHAVFRMKGRSPWNKSSNRKADVYKLLVQMGGEARWKTLKAHLEELGLGPTTLKQTLDEMVTEKSITKEARLGAGGAEVWYKTQIKGSFWERFANSLNKDIKYWFQDPQEYGQQPKELINPLPSMIDDIRKQASALKEKERQCYLSEQLQKIVRMAAEEYVTFLYNFVSLAHSDGKNIMDQVFQYYISDILLQQTKDFQNFLSEYPNESLQAIQDFLKIGGNPATSQLEGGN